MDAGHLTGWLLVGGAVLFWMGAGNPYLVRAWTASQEDYLAIVAKRPGAWRFTSLLLMTGTVVTAAGFAGLPALLPDGWGRALGSGAVGAFEIAATLWIISLLYRHTVLPTTARTFVETGVVDVGSAPLDRLSGGLFKGFIVIGFAAIGALGVAATAGGPIGPMLGWGSAVVSALLVAGLVAFGNVPPLTIYIPTFAFGVAVLATG